MKSSLQSENNEILLETIALTTLLKSESQKQILHKCIFKFRKLSKEWTNFVDNSEAALKSTNEKKSKALNSISIYKKNIRKINQKIKKVDRKQKNLVHTENQVASQLSVFPKLWGDNVHKLRQKSLSWRVTPCAFPQYDQELSFLNESTRKKNDEYSEIQDVSLEFERLMKEFEALKPEEKYEGDNISIE